VKQSGSDVQIDGTSLNASALSSEPKKTEVQQAIRFDRVLIVKFVALKRNCPWNLTKRLGAAR
jgi:hypothetical protein